MRKIKTKSIKRNLLSILLSLVISFSTLYGMGVISSDSYATSHADTLMNMQIVALDGNTYSLSDFDEDYIVILFGRSGCTNTMSMARKAASLRDDKHISVKLIIMGVDSSDEGLSAKAQEYGAIGSVNSPYNNRLMWSLLDSGSITFPATFVLNVNRELVMETTGNKQNELKSALSISSPRSTYTVDVCRYQDDARRMLASINDFRTGSDAWEWNSTNTEKVYHSNLRGLEYDYGLEVAAMKRAQEIAVSYSHTRPNGGYFTTAYPGDPYSCAENIAAGYTTADSVFTAWREDDYGFSGQGHRRNMLNGNFSYVGIGHVVYEGVHYWVQEFGYFPLDLTYKSLESVHDATGNGRSIKAEIEIADDIINSKEYSCSYSSKTINVGGKVDLPELYLMMDVDGYFGWYSDKVKADPDVDYSWIVEPAGIAAINDGRIEGLNAGQCTLKAASGSTVLKSVSITVNSGNSNGGNSNGGGSGNNNGNSDGNSGNDGSNWNGNGSDNGDSNGNDGSYNSFDFSAYGLSNEYVPDGYVDYSGSSMIIDGKDLSWNDSNGKAYWYENGVKQGTYYDPKGVIGDGTNRGREICDNNIKDLNGNGTWFWLDACYDGAKAVGKEVWVPYIYQKEAEWDDTTLRNIANESDAGMADLVYIYMKEKNGKWVRYDEEGRMIKGWVTIQGALADKYPDQVGNTYYYDTRTGLMAKGNVKIGGVEHFFDEITGVMVY